jgi:cell division protease FtsH
MSEKLGRLSYEANDEEVFLGHSVTQHKNVSDDTARMIDEEVRSIVEEAEDLARKVLNDHMDDLHIIGKALLEYETLSGEEVDALLRGEELHRDDHATVDSPPPSGTVPSAGKHRGGENPGDMEPEPQPGS